MVSHRSRSSLIANLITNKPAFSSSLPHALLQGRGGEGKEEGLTSDTPTLLRRGLPIRVLKTSLEIDQEKMTNLLERSFRKTLNADSFYRRLQTNLDFVIVAGDYVGAAIVTKEPCPSSADPNETLTYLDKFAVLPSHQGTGTVDFLWVALHDESYGLGLPYSVNPNGGKEGRGMGRDLVWRSRADNPINKWYFERSSGHVRVSRTSIGENGSGGGKIQGKGEWMMFWCDAEQRLKDVLSERGESTGRSRAQLSYVEEEERGRVGRWWDAVEKIDSVWV